MSELSLLNWLHDFHWQRPIWLVLIPIALLLCWYLSKIQSASNNWKSLIDPQLLPHLLQGQLSEQQKLPLWGLFVALVLASLAMAGPSWEKLPQPIHKNESALVILLDLSPSMVAEDLKPARIIRARLKLIDLLQQRQEGLSALIAYAGEAHIVTPLTDDTETIISLLPSLSPGLMPLRGSNVEDALDHALKLFKEAGLSEGDILLVTDGVADDAKRYLVKHLPSSFRLSVLGVGTPEGAPIPSRNGGFAKDRNGAIVLAKLNSDQLSELAANSGGVYRTLSNTDSDLKAFISQPDILNQQTRQLEREFDTWRDRGALLSLLLIPLMVLSFRRGWLLCLPLLLIFPEQSQAFGWNDLWYTKDQQGQRLMRKQQTEEASKTFQRNDWKGTAAYRAEDYESAIKAFGQDTSPSAFYNKGNALAKAGKLEEAIAAYTKALEKDPQFDDAQANKALIESFLKQQQDQQKQQDQKGTENNNDQQSQQDSASQDTPENQAADQNSENPSSDQDQSSQDSAPQQENQNTSDNTDEATQKNNETPSPAEQPQEQQVADEEKSNDQTDSDTEQLAEGETSQAQLSQEEQQAMEQWLRKIPDDPSGLMRKKFEYQYRQRRKEYQQGNWQPPANDANNRW